MRAMIAINSLLLLAASSTASATNWPVAVGGMSSDGYGYGSPVLAFSPATITINVGDSVTFTNVGGAHNVHADDNSFRCADGCDDTGGNGSVSSGWIFTRTFTTAGTFGFHCDAHAAMGMTGTIVVNATTPPFTLGGYLSGNWFVPSQGGGHGFQLEMTDAINSATGKPIMLAIWFVYTPAGSSAGDGSGQNWIYAQGDYDPTTSTVTLPAFLLAGARFPPNFNPSDVHTVSGDSSGRWGSLTFAFSDCDNGLVSWTSTLPAYGSSPAPVAIQRLTKIAGTTCP